MVLKIFRDVGRFTLRSEVDKSLWPHSSSRSSLERLKEFSYETGYCNSRERTVEFWEFELPRRGERSGDYREGNRQP